MKFLHSTGKVFMLKIKQPLVETSKNVKSCTKDMKLFARWTWNLNEKFCRQKTFLVTLVFGVDLYGEKEEYIFWKLLHAFCPLLLDIFNSKLPKEQSVCKYLRVTVRVGKFSLDVCSFDKRTRILNGSGVFHSRKLGSQNTP